MFKFLNNKINRLLVVIKLCQEDMRWCFAILRYLEFFLIKSAVSSIFPGLKKKIEYNLLSLKINMVRNQDIMLIRESKTLTVCVTYRCNLACKFCYATGLKNEMPMDMHLDDFCRLIHWAKDNGLLTIRLQGGEVTIHPQFLEMLRLCSRNHLFVNLATNNLFPSNIIPELESPWLRNITINYVLGNIKDNNSKIQLFKGNLQELKKKRIPFGFSYILSPQDENWKDMLKDAEIYIPRYIGVTLSIPGFSKQISISQLFKDADFIINNIFSIKEFCIKMNIPFYIYRPLLMCMLSQEQWQRLREISPYVALLRCPLAYKDNRNNYITQLTVNPDLSIFPCACVFIKGPNIFSFKNKDGIGRFYKDRLKTLLSKPLLDSCKTCVAHNNFILSLDEIKRIKSKFDEDICQAGCLDFRQDLRMQCYEGIKYE